MQAINTINHQQPIISTSQQNSITSLARKVAEFTSRNKGSIFLALSVLASVAFSPQLLAFNAGCKIMAYTLLTFSSLQIFTVMFGRNELMTARTGEQINALLGVVNLCVLYLFPGIAIATSICSSSIGVASLLMRNITAIDPERA